MVTQETLPTLGLSFLICGSDWNFPANRPELVLMAGPLPGLGATSPPALPSQVLGKHMGNLIAHSDHAGGNCQCTRNCDSFHRYLIEAQRLRKWQSWMGAWDHPFRRKKLRPREGKGLSSVTQPCMLNPIPNLGHPPQEAALVSPARSHPWRHFVTGSSVQTLLLVLICLSPLIWLAAWFPSAA